MTTNRDRQINVSDYQLWRATFGSVVNLAADGNGSGAVDAADYVVWRDHLTSAAGSVMVPEPRMGAYLLLFATRLALLFRNAS